MTNFGGEPNSLYRNVEGELFDDAGSARERREPDGQRFVRWGTQFADFGLTTDGPDLYAVGVATRLRASCAPLAAATRAKAGSNVARRSWPTASRRASPAGNRGGVAVAEPMESRRAITRACGWRGRSAVADIDNELETLDLLHRGPVRAVPASSGRT